jgi:hypothetical protein
LSETSKIYWQSQEKSGCHLKHTGNERLKAEIQRGGAGALDLEELDLIDVEGIRFLNLCEAKGISVLHCSPYIRRRMSRERSSEARTQREKGHTK